MESSIPILMHLTWFVIIAYHCFGLWKIHNSRWFWTLFCIAFFSLSVSGVIHSMLLSSSSQYSTSQDTRPSITKEILSQSWHHSSRIAKSKRIQHLDAPFNVLSGSNSFDDDEFDDDEADNHKPDGNRWNKNGLHDNECPFRRYENLTSEVALNWNVFTFDFCMSSYCHCYKSSTDDPCSDNEHQKDYEDPSVNPWNDPPSRKDSRLKPNGENHILYSSVQFARSHSAMPNSKKVNESCKIVYDDSNVVASSKITVSSSDSNRALPSEGLCIGISYTFFSCCVAVLIYGIPTVREDHFARQMWASVLVTMAAFVIIFQFDRLEANFKLVEGG